MNRSMGANTVETQKILLTIEFAVLAGALLSVFIRYQLKRTSKPARAARLRQSRVMTREEKKSVRGSVEKGAADQAAAQTEAVVNAPRSWPQHGSSRGIRVERPSSSEAMNALVNCLVREKNLLPRKASDVRLNLILEAFLERRQVPASVRLPLRPASE